MNGKGLGLYQTGSLVSGIDGKAPDWDGKVLSHTKTPMEKSVDGRTYDESGNLINASGQVLTGQSNMSPCCHGSQMKRIIDTSGDTIGRNDPFAGGGMLDALKQLQANLVKNAPFGAELPGRQLKPEERILWYEFHPDRDANGHVRVKATHRVYGYDESGNPLDGEGKRIPTVGYPRGSAVTKVAYNL